MANSPNMDPPHSRRKTTKSLKRVTTLGPTNADPRFMRDPTTVNLHTMRGPTTFNLRIMCGPSNVALRFMRRVQEPRF